MPTSTQRFLNPVALTNCLFDKGIEMTALTKKAGISAGTIARALRLHRPVRPSTAKKIADALGVSVHEILEPVETDEKGA